MNNLNDKKMTKEEEVIVNLMLTKEKYEELISNIYKNITVKYTNENITLDVNKNLIINLYEHIADQSEKDLLNKELKINIV